MKINIEVMIHDKLVEKAEDYGVYGISDKGFERLTRETIDMLADMAVATVQPVVFMKYEDDYNNYE